MRAGNEVRFLPSLLSLSWDGDGDGVRLSWRGWS